MFMVLLKLKFSKVQRPNKHIIGHIREEFLGSDDPNDNVKALKEDYGADCCCHDEVIARVPFCLS